MREPDDALGLYDIASGALCDARRGKNTIHRLRVPAVGLWAAARPSTMLTVRPLIASGGRWLCCRCAGGLGIADGAVRDRCPDGAACPPCHLPDGRGGVAPVGLHGPFLLSSTAYAGRLSRRLPHDLDCRSRSVGTLRSRRKRGDRCRPGPRSSVTGQRKQTSIYC